jgi:hypothetical protein
MIYFACGPDSVNHVLHLRERNLDLHRGHSSGIYGLAKPDDDTLRSLGEYYADRQAEQPVRIGGHDTIYYDMLNREPAMVFYGGSLLSEDITVEEKELRVKRFAQELALGMLPKGVDVECEMEALGRTRLGS